MNFWNIASTHQDSVLDMYVYGEIKTDHSWFFGSPDDVITRDFIKDLQKYPKAKRINVHINSGGGEVFAAVAIAQQLKKHQAEVHTYVEGLAASAATIIAMAGDVRHMTVSSLYMIHLPSTQLRGNKHEIAKGIEILEKVEDIIRLTYQNKTKLSDEELTKMIDKETWLTAPEAKKFGFVSEIEEDPNEEEEGEGGGEKKLDSLIKDVAEDIVSINGVEFDITAYADPAQLKAKLQNIKNQIGGITMDFTAFLNTLSEDNQKALMAHISAQIAEKTAPLTAQVTDLTGQLSTVTDQLKTAQDAARNAEARAKAAEDQLTQLQDKEDADTKFLDSLPSDAKNAVLEARRVAAEAQQRVEALQDEKAFADFKASLSTLENLPIADDHIQALYNISKAAPEDYKALATLLQPANAAMDSLMQSVGADQGKDAPTDAYEQLNQLAEKKMAADDKLSYNDAFQQAVQENPGLYDQYRMTL